MYDHTENTLLIRFCSVKVPRIEALVVLVPWWSFNDFPSN